MSTSFIRWGGPAAMVGSVLWAMWTIGFNFVGYGEPGTPVYERYAAYNRLLPLALVTRHGGLPRVTRRTGEKLRVDG